MVKAVAHSEGPRESQWGYHPLSNAMDIGDHTESETASSYMGLKFSVIIGKGFSTLQDIALSVWETSKGELLYQQLSL